MGASVRGGRVLGWATSKCELPGLLVPPTPATEGILLQNPPPAGRACRAGDGAGADAEDASITGTTAVSDPSRALGAGAGEGLGLLTTKGSVRDSMDDGEVGRCLVVDGGAVRPAGSALPLDPAL